MTRGSLQYLLLQKMGFLVSSLSFSNTTPMCIVLRKEDRGASCLVIYLFFIYLFCSKTSSSPPFLVNSPIMVSSELGRIDVAAHLLRHGADANWTRTSDHATPLSMAAQHGRIDVVSLLVEHGANVNSRYTHTKKEMWGGCKTRTCLTCSITFF